VLRRVEPSKTVGEEPLIIDEDLAIDFPRRTVIARGEHIKLRPTEYRLLVAPGGERGVDCAAGDAAGKGVGAGVSR
jgi:hypothetical protein